MATQGDRVEGSAAPAAPNAPRSGLPDLRGFSQGFTALTGLFCALLSEFTANLAWLPLSALLACGWFDDAHQRLRVAALTGKDPHAVRRLFTIPLALLLAVMAVPAVLIVEIDLKNASFVWDSLPTQTIGDRMYEWPGVYDARILRTSDKSSNTAYVTGGPFVPLPSDTPEEAAFRVTRYLAERFDLDADPAWVADALARSREATGSVPSGHGSRVEKHPYTAGMYEIEARYEPEARRTLLLRTTAGYLCALLLGAIVLRAGAGRPPRWTQSKSLAIATAVSMLALLFWPGSDPAVYGAMLPLLRFHAEHAFVVTTAGVLLAAGLLRSAYFRAQAVAAELATPPRGGPSDRA